MNEQEFKRFGEQIKEQGETNGGTMYDLIFNPVTGDFEQKPKGTSFTGDKVTVFPDGFA